MTCDDLRRDQDSMAESKKYAKGGKLGEKLGCVALHTGGRGHGEEKRSVSDSPPGHHSDPAPAAANLP